MNEDIQRVVDNILQSRKYKAVSPDLIYNISYHEFQKNSHVKNATKAVKVKLNQIYATYLQRKLDYSNWLNKLEIAFASKKREDIICCCKEIMSYHSSTKNRLSIVDEFYQTIFSNLPKINSIMDLGCGFHPLAIPLMNLNSGVDYYGYDIANDMMQFLERVVSLMNVNGYFGVCNILESCPEQQVDLTIMLKTIPCLDRIDKNAAERLLQNLQSRYILISFPISDIYNKRKEMVDTYSNRFQELIANKNWSFERYLFATEIAFVLCKGEV